MADDGYTRITLRIPAALDELLSTEAQETSKSKNAEIIQRLEQSFNQQFNKDHSSQLNNIQTRLALALEGAGKVTRIESASNTGAQTDQVIAMFERPGLEIVRLFARRGGANRPSLTVTCSYADQACIVADTFDLTGIRSARMLDIARITRSLDKIGKLEGAWFCPTVVENTEDKDPGAAFSHLLREHHFEMLLGEIRLHDFLALISDQKEFNYSSESEKNSFFHKE